MQSVAKFFNDGGSLMYINVLVAVFALAIISERLYMFLFRLRVNTKVFMAEVEKLVPTAEAANSAMEVLVFMLDPSDTQTIRLPRRGHRPICAPPDCARGGRRRAPSSSARVSRW